MRTLCLFTVLMLVLLSVKEGFTKNTTLQSSKKGLVIPYWPRHRCGDFQVGIFMKLEKIILQIRKNKYLMKRELFIGGVTNRTAFANFVFYRLIKLYLNSNF